jgi:tetratricopeptide (TPR) repeat protein
MGTGSSAVAKIKQIGNDYFKEGDYTKAAKAYSKALKIDKSNAILLSNRSACYVKIGKLKQAIDDSLECVKQASGWHKAYYRLAVSLNACGLISESLVAANKSLMIEDDQGVRALISDLSKQNPQPSRNNLMIWDPSHIRPSFIPQLEGIPIIEL